jgi:hypothetical protein
MLLLDCPLSPVPQIFNLLTESEGSTGKYQTKVLLYRPSDNEVNTARPRFDIFPYCPKGRGQLTFYYYIWHCTYVCKKIKNMICEYKVQSAKHVQNVNCKNLSLVSETSLQHLL